MNGQKIYFYEVSYGMTTGKAFLVASGYIAPRAGETVTVYDEDTEVFRHWEVVNVSHGCRIKNTAAGELNTVVHAKLIKEEKKNEE